MWDFIVLTSRHFLSCKYEWYFIWSGFVYRRALFPERNNYDNAGVFQQRQSIVATINLISVLCLCQKYFTCMTAVSLMWYEEFGWRVEKTGSTSHVHVAIVAKY